MAYPPTYCLKGHFIGWKGVPPGSDWSDIQSFALEDEFDPRGKRIPDYCVKCGARTIDACEHCKTLLYEDRDGDCPLYCGACGKALPWTEFGLRAANELIDEAEEFSADEKAGLRLSFPELTRDTAATPGAIHRVRKMAAKAGPAVSKALLAVAQSIATAEVKRHLGLP